MIFVASGQWLGRGSLLAEGQSRGRQIDCDVRVERDDSGATLTGSWSLDGAPGPFAVRVASNDAGLYTVAVELAGELLEGTAKLDSAPNVGLLWNAAGSVHATFAVFQIARGFGFRGFLRDTAPGAPDGGRVLTWEVAFSLKQEVIKGDNIVSLRRRRP